MAKKESNKERNAWLKPTITVMKIRETLQKPAFYFAEEHADTGRGDGKFIDDGPS